MLVALSPATAALYAPIRLQSTDRLEISLDDTGEKFIAIICGEKTRIGRNYPSDSARVNFVARIPERTRLTNLEKSLGGLANIWALSATDITASLIRALWPLNQVSFSSEAFTVYEYLLATCVQLNHNAENYARWKINKEVPEHGLQYCGDKPLLPYQHVALDSMYRSEGFGLFMEQGTGKTPVSIACIDNLAVNNTSGKPLKGIIVCPNNARLNWQSEFYTFSTVHGKITVLRGDMMARTKAFIDALTLNDGEEYSIIVTGYDIVDRFAPLLKYPWDFAISDESHYFKSPTTKRFDAMMRLRDTSARRYCLTGTAVCNSIADLYAQFEFMSKGASGFVSAKNFRSFYVSADTGPSGCEKIIGYQNLPFAQERLARYTFAISLKEALPDLPERTYDLVEVDMTAHQWDVYKKVKRDLYYKIERQLAGSTLEKSFMISNILTQLLRLAHVTSGFVTWDEIVDDEGNILQPKEVERFSEQPKLDVMLDLVKSQPSDEKTLIWACWISDIQAIAERLTSEGIEFVSYWGKTSEAKRKEAVERFNNDDSVKCFVANPGAGGTALNLIGYPPHYPELSACDTTQEIFFSQDWSQVKRSQAESRAIRNGTRRRVQIRDLTVVGTIDEEMRARVVSKKIMSLEIGDLHDILKNVLNGVA